MSSGTNYRVSDLYAMRWKPVVDGASKRAYASGTLSEDIRAEQDKIEWAETIILLVA